MSDGALSDDVTGILRLGASLSVRRLEENVAAARIDLSADEVRELADAA